MKSLAILAAFVLGLAARQDSKPAELKILVAAVNSKRGDAFEALLKKHGLKTGSIALKDLTKEKAAGFDVVLADPEVGEANAHGQSASRSERIPGDLGKPVMAIGAPGSYALIPLQLKFGNNG